MKVTFALPLHGFLGYGGAEVQAEMTAAELRKLGVDVEFLTPLTKELGDLVHAFGPYDSFGPLVGHAKARNVPFVVSTINYTHYSNSFAYWRDVIRTRRRRHPLRLRKALFEAADLLLPNSQAEKDFCLRLFKLDPRRIIVIPNGVAPRFAKAEPHIFRERFGIDGEFVLNVARVEKRKNQLNLIRALRGTGIPLVIIGKTLDANYLRECQQASDGHVRFLPALDHEDPALASAYAAAKVFALPSRLETPGIAALEAALAGARVVITPIGGAREYFGEYARYVDPSQVDSIRASLLAAWNDEHYDAQAVRTHILNHFTWAKVAEQTLAAYATVARIPA